jgi:hypothetical protein
VSYDTAILKVTLKGCYPLHNQRPVSKSRLKDASLPRITPIDVSLVQSHIQSGPSHPLLFVPVPPTHILPALRTVLFPISIHFRRLETPVASYHAVQVNDDAHASRLECISFASSGGGGDAG